MIVITGAGIAAAAILYLIFNKEEKTEVQSWQEFHKEQETQQSLRYLAELDAKDPNWMDAYREQYGPYTTSSNKE